jgi:hypothetical protein
VDVAREIAMQNAEEEAEAQRTVQEAIEEAAELEKPLRGERSLPLGAAEQPAVSTGPNGQAEPAASDGGSGAEQFQPYSSQVPPNPPQ